MSMWSALSRTQAPAYAPALAGIRRATAVLVLTVATAFVAWLAIPVPGSPVPITLQTFCVLAGAALLGGRWSTWAQAAYLVLGGIGLPWFAGSAWGAPVFFGATGGYLVGFVLASWLVGRLLASTTRFQVWRVLLALCAGEAVILACGVTWLAVALHVSWPAALAMGALPFLPGDAVKLAAAAALVKAAGARTRRFVA
jgi:biotin transport system substrate-specific component